MNISTGLFVEWSQCPHNLDARPSKGVGAQSGVGIYLNTYSPSVSASTLVSVSDNPVCVTGISSLAFTGFEFDASTVDDNSGSTSSGPSLDQVLKLKITPQQACHIGC